MQLIFQLAILLMSVVIHEFAHGWAALQLGDKTAKYAGRLTLNPIKHLDPFGSVLLPVLLYIATSGGAVFGWAKPVPFNPYNLKDKKYGEAKVAVAGAAANFLVAVFFSLAIRFTPESYLASSGLFEILSLIVFINILLGVFNLVPIPPLDGSKVLFAFLPRSLDNIRAFMEQYGTIVLILFIVFAFRIIIPIVYYLYSLLTGFNIV